MSYLLAFIFEMAGIVCVISKQDPKYIFGCFLIAALYVIAYNISQITVAMKEKEDE